MDTFTFRAPAELAYQARFAAGILNQTRSRFIRDAVEARIGEVRRLVGLAEAEERVKQVEEQTSVIEGELESLSGFIEELEQRLAGLMQPTPDEGVEECKEEESLVPYAERLRTIYYSVRSVRVRLSSVLGGLEF